MQQDFECTFCGAIFGQRTKRGACPCCGGPGPIRMEPERRVEVKTEYIQETKGFKTTIPYYTPAKKTLKQSVFKTLGFRLTFVVGFLALVVLIVSFIQAFQIGSPSELSDENLRIQAPKVQIIPTVSENYSTTNSILEDLEVEWLGPVQSKDLRLQNNAVNLIVLSQDEIKIAKEFTVQFDETWDQKRPYFVEAVSVVEETGVVVEIGSKQYNINAYMPFVYQQSPVKVVIVDHKGRLWTKDLDQIDLLSLESVEIPIVVKPNENLEIVFSKQ